MGKRLQFEPSELTRCLEVEAGLAKFTCRFGGSKRERAGVSAPERAPGRGKDTVSQGSGGAREGSGLNPWML